MGQGPSTPNTIKTYSNSINNKDINPNKSLLKISLENLNT